MHILNLRNNVLLHLTSSNNNTYIYFKETGINFILHSLWQGFPGGHAREKKNRHHAKRKVIKGNASRMFTNFIRTTEKDWNLSRPEPSHLEQMVWFSWKVMMWIAGSKWMDTVNWGVCSPRCTWKDKIRQIGKKD